MSRFETGKMILFVARARDAFDATEASCTNEEADLSLGILSADILTCQLHQAKFDIRSGQVLEGPNGTDPSTIRQLGNFRTKVQNDEVLANL